MKVKIMNKIRIYSLSRQLKTLEFLLLAALHLTYLGFGECMKL